MGVTVLSCEVEQVEATQGEVALALGGITVGGKAAGLKGSLVVVNGDVELAMGVSKLEGEELWTVDALTINGVPNFVNGYGARYLQTQVLKSAALAAALDAAAEGVVA